MDVPPKTSPIKKVKSPLQDVLNPKTSVTCSKVPEGLFDATAAKKHFSKFGRVTKIRLLPKRQMCIIDYEQPNSAERAVLNAGAYDGFMFDVTRSKARMRRRSKRDDDPDWVPDSDVEEELSAMGGASTYMTRQKDMEVESELPSPSQSRLKTLSKVMKNTPLKKKLPARVKGIISQPAVSEPVAVTTLQTTLSTMEAAVELNQLRNKVSLSPDEQWRTLDARDRILRAWGGAGSRIKVGGATIGTCQDMCPEKELLHRQAEHQVMTLETILDSDGELEPWRAVKQYSRSSADQEIPMCYELRPAAVLMRTCAYLLHEIADTKRQVSLADWFHFMWDRFRGIRKDITQQALCCAESIRLVEMCARFHAHCAARLADLEHTQFDQKLNTDNLTKCLQTLKHMYADVSPEEKPREAEFRGYVALLNLGDANFWWEIKQLPEEIQKSRDISFAMKVFNALDNNNYVRFFRLVRNEANYLQACILLRYFNDVRARALARMVKAFAPRGGSRYPVDEVMASLAFESVESLKSFINHYGLRFARTEDSELAVILDRNQFIEDSDPYPTARSINLIESKRTCSVGEIIAGGILPRVDYSSHPLYTSFTPAGKLKESALVAGDQGYNTRNDSNKDIQALKSEIQRLSQGGKIQVAEKIPDARLNMFAKPETKSVSPIRQKLSEPVTSPGQNKLFSFKPAIPVASTDIIKNSPEKIFEDNKNVFAFSKPQETATATLFTGPRPATNVFDSSNSTQVKGIFGKPSQSNTSLFSTTKPDSNPFKKPDTVNPLQSNLFSSTMPKNVFAVKDKVASNVESSSKNIFAGTKDNIFAKKESAASSQSSQNIFGAQASSDKDSQQTSIFGASKAESTNIFTKTNESNAKQENNIFSKPSSSTNIFANAGAEKPNIFAKPSTEGVGLFTKPKIGAASLFTKPENNGNIVKSSIFANGNVNSEDMSPKSLFKAVVNDKNEPDAKSYSIFQSKNKAQTVADSILNSVTPAEGSVYDYTQDDIQKQKEAEMQRLHEEKLKEQLRIENAKREEQRLKEIRRLEEERRKEELRKQEELRQLEKERQRKEEERKQEELKKRLEEERKAALKRKAEQERMFKERVDRESGETVEELSDEINDETVKNILKEEMDSLTQLILFANTVTNDIMTELCNDICASEMAAEQFLTRKLMTKWFNVWKKHYLRNVKRRDLLENTPVWLTQYSPVEEANHLRRFVEHAALKNMNAFHCGHKFTGELKQLPSPEKYKVMEIIRSPLLKRMKQIHYPYDKCFFWKLTVVSPGTNKWMSRKISIEQWLSDAFSDNKKHDESQTLLQVGKQSWNNLMDFAISVSMISQDNKIAISEAMEGTNALLFYATALEHNLANTIEETLKHKYPYQVVPVAVIIPKMDNMSVQINVENLLADLVRKNVLSAYRVYVVDPANVFESLNVSTKSAMKWLARKFPQNPPVEIDYLKSICQRYLGNEIWCRLRTEQDMRMKAVLKDLCKLINCYNMAVDQLLNIITNEDLFNYPSFALEFKTYLNIASPYPKPFEFIPSNVKSPENIFAIKRLMSQLKLPYPSSDFNPVCAISMQQQITNYCNQIEWFQKPEEVACKVVALLPSELSNVSIPSEDYVNYFSQYNLIDFMNIIIYEKINSLKNFENRFAIYEKSVLDNYGSILWVHETSIINELKHKPLEGEDDIDFYIKAKRRKIELDSLELLMLEDKDCTLVEENIREKDMDISKINNCAEAVKPLEQKLEEENKRSLEFENLLRAALADV